ncbi:TetR/AcrR family transcriptional regulator [Micromonospora fluostatini]|uniref:TetR/AcrR family transcriptional regulator n=1 Tax=Micromonospora fluostatini TaxID=1629071 RepID=A0ABY2DFD7_9ACTN|nr:TetR/AcrR family transcriptional regulator [Micromonospora fluostatini]
MSGSDRSAQRTSGGDGAAGRRATRRTGRRPGNPDTREAILDAARRLFAERGYDGASIRAVAATAGVDPALVHHYFGAKDRLFLAALDAPADPAAVIPQVTAGDPGGLGERLVRLFLTVWDSPAGAGAVALLRSSMTNDRTARMLRDFLVTQVLRRLLEHLDTDPAELPLRGSLVAGQLVGLAVTRYVLRLEPVASASPETLVAAVGPAVHRYLTGDLT